MHWINALGLGLILVSSSAEAQPSPTGPCQHTLRGQVLDADLHTPVVGAVVVASTVQNATRTDESGTFSFTGVCAGSIRVVVSKAGFSSTETTVNVPSAAPLIIRFAYAMVSVTITAPAVDPLENLGFDDRLEGEELAETRGLGLADTLQRASGVQVIRAGTVTKPVIDGFFGSRILILNDGLRHHAQLWGLDHAPEIDPFSAQRLTVIRGAEGVRYGADGLGGVISIEPAPFIDPQAPGIQGEVNLVGMTNGRQGIANASLSGTVPGLPRLSARVQGSVKKAGSFETPNYPLDNTGAEDLGASGAVRYAGDGFEVSLGASYVSNEYGLFTGIRSEGIRDFEDALTRDVPRNVELFEFAYEIERPFSRVNHTYVRSQARIDIASWGTLGLLYGYQYNDRREFELTRRPTESAQLRFTLDTHAVEATLDHSLFDVLQGTGGLSATYQVNDHSGRRLIPDYDRIVGGAFLLERYEGENFEIAAGLRYERQQMDTEQPARIAPNRNPPERFSLGFDALMATLAAKITPDPAWTFHGHLARASRIPTINELFIDGAVPGVAAFEVGDRDLKPEVTLNLGLGVGYRNSWLDAEVTAYVHHIDDYIYNAPRIDSEGNPRTQLTINGAFPSFEYRNLDVLYAGGTVDVTVSPVPWFEWRSRASYVRARNLEDRSFLVNIPADRYENRLAFLTYTSDNAEPDQFWIESVIVRRQEEFDINADFLPPPEGYHLINLGAKTHFLVGPQEVRASIDLRNLFNSSYRDYLSRLRYFADEPGFQAILRLSTSFEARYEG